MNAKLFFICSLNLAIVASQAPPELTKPPRQDMQRERLTPLLNSGDTFLEDGKVEVSSSPRSINSAQSNAENDRVCNNTGRGCVCCTLVLCGVIIWGAVKLAKGE